MHWCTTVCALGSNTLLSSFSFHCYRQWHHWRHYMCHTGYHSCPWITLCICPAQVGKLFMGMNLLLESKHHQPVGHIHSWCSPFHSVVTLQHYMCYAGYHSHLCITILCTSWVGDLFMDMNLLLENNHHQAVDTFIMITIPLCGHL